MRRTLQMVSQSNTITIGATVPTHVYCLGCFDFGYMGDLLKISHVSPIKTTETIHMGFACSADR